MDDRLRYDWKMDFSRGWVNQRITKDIHMFVWIGEIWLRSGFWLDGFDFKWVYYFGLDRFDEDLDFVINFVFYAWFIFILTFDDRIQI